MYGESSSMCSIFYIDDGIPRGMLRSLVPNQNPGGIPGGIPGEISVGIGGMPDPDEDYEVPRVGSQAGSQE